VSGVRLGVDVGGTFTDLVAIVDGRVVTAKVPTTPADQSEAVMATIEAADLDPGRVDAFAHGMTVATNALLERKGARTALVTTEGFRDILEIGRQDRPSLYDLRESRPEPLVPRERRVTVRERMGPGGEITPLDEESLERGIKRLREAGVEAVAVCLLFAFLHPEHERRVGEAVREALPEAHVSLSSEVLPEFREFERCATTAADAYLAPLLGAYLERLSERVREAGVPAPLVMQSSGGIAPLELAVHEAAATLLSGPAGGVVGAAHAAGASDHRDVLTFDMGGTSTDVAAVVDGAALTTTETVVAGVPVKLPMIDVHTVSAGGGSIAWADAGGALRVGPHSAGADPGPAAYGAGGEEPTVTDANLLLGYLEDGRELGGRVTLRRHLAEAALERLGERLGMEAEEAARGVIRVADTEMVRALRVISVERGLDPREFALVAFGGAGPMHACSLAEELGIETVLVPRASGVLSALGLAMSDLRRDLVHPFHAKVGETGDEELGPVFERMEEQAARDLDGPGFLRRADLRYAGQSFELTVDGGEHDRLAERFHQAHERRYGYRMDDEEIEVVNLRVVATVEVDRPELSEGEPTGDAEPGRRPASFDGDWEEVPVHARSGLGRGSGVKGPAIVEFDEATLVVRPGWAGEVDTAGTLVVRRA
jgi:N-methylhydantoinase A